MRSRFPLLLKKRGGRRTGSHRWGRAGEISYQAVFVVAGMIGAWWCLTDVLLPERELAAEVDQFVRAEATVIDKRVIVRDGLAEDEYCPELQLRYQPEGRQPVTAWTRHGVGRDSPSRDEAQIALRRFAEGEQLTCWYDPRAPRRVVLTKGGRWWPWFVLVIPVSLVIAGCFGVWRALVRVQTSPERRARTTAEKRNAIDPESPQENPGVRLAYRLPLDGGESWRLSGMAALCVMWNLLAALVIYQAIGFESVSGRVVVTVLAVAPLAAIGIWMVRSLWRDATTVGGFGATRIELAQHPLSPGSTCAGVLIQAGAGRVRMLEASLVCEEVATYSQGTDSRVATLEASRVPLLRRRGLLIEAGEPLEIDFQLEIPDEGPLSFRSPHNAVRWAIEVRLAPAHASEATRRFPVLVSISEQVADSSPTVTLADEPATLDTAGV